MADIVDMDISCSFIGNNLELVAISNQIKISLYITCILIGWNNTYIYIYIIHTHIRWITLIRYTGIFLCNYLF